MPPPTTGLSPVRVVGGALVTVCRVGDELVARGEDPRFQQLQAGAIGHVRAPVVGQAVGAVDEAPEPPARVDADATAAGIRTAALGRSPSLRLRPRKAGHQQQQ
ncbi:hypothetical protein VTK73DRAFT_3720 [Phialemonium thermophilum]|uniref:Uncharacterized protein n=1 Tax=Phialemonium thermophilum TaxID=223376 RepID=A0ABR3VFF5_9PEZI